MIVVARRSAPRAQYIGRPSPLGNPYVMRGENDRDRVCDAYAAWFAARVQARDPRVLEELKRLYKIAREGDLVLGCYCAPRRCHGDTIKAFLDARLAAHK